jgi:hypothetical protein
MVFVGQPLIAHIGLQSQGFIPNPPQACCGDHSFARYLQGVLGRTRGQAVTGETLILKTKV